MVKWIHPCVRIGFWLRFAVLFLLAGLLLVEHGASQDITIEHSLYNAPLVMVIGGNGFIGAYTVQALVNEGYRVVIVNRGGSYFDAQDTILSQVEKIYWDRRFPIAENTDIRDFLHLNNRLHAVIDFSCYDGRAAEDLAVYLLSYKVKWLVYISTDSVYEVCDKKHSGPTREEDAVRPDDMLVEAQLNKADSYGNRKLAAEETIAEIKKDLRGQAGVWDYVFVRIPDVVGPRDTTYRWWLYQLLVKLYPTLDVPIPLVEADQDNRRMSVVYVGDVAKAVLWLISDQNNKLVNTAINIASEETVTFKQFITDIATELKMDYPIRYVLNESTDFPSVKRGPIDVSKAHTYMKWQSKPWKEVVQEAVPFYEQAMLDPTFVRDRDGALTLLYQETIRWSKQEMLKDALQIVYGLNHTIVDQLLDEDDEVRQRRESARLVASHGKEL